MQTLYIHATQKTPVITQIIQSIIMLHIFFKATKNKKYILCLSSHHDYPLVPHIFLISSALSPLSLCKTNGSFSSMDLVFTTK